MAAQERDASSSGDEESGSRGALWAPGVEEDGSEFFSALSCFNTVGALDIAGGMRSLAEDRLKRANADLKAGADASRRVHRRQPHRRDVEGGAGYDAGRWRGTTDRHQ